MLIRINPPDNSGHHFVDSGHHFVYLVDHFVDSDQQSGNFFTFPCAVDHVRSKECKERSERRAGERELGDQGLGLGQDFTSASSAQGWGLSHS